MSDLLSTAAEDLGDVLRAIVLDSSLPIAGDGWRVTSRTPDGYMPQEGATSWSVHQDFLLHVALTRPDPTP